MFSKLWYVQKKNGGNLNFLLTSSRLSIGRQSTSHIRLKKTSVSKVHCEIELDGLTPVLFNHSKNGTFLNKKKITAAQVMTNGDEITISNGESFTLHNITQQKIEETIILSDDDMNETSKNENDEKKKVIYISSEDESDDSFDKKIKVTEKKHCAKNEKSWDSDNEQNEKSWESDYDSAKNPWDYINKQTISSPQYCPPTPAYMYMPTSMSNIEQAPGLNDLAPYEPTTPTNIYYNYMPTSLPFETIPRIESTQGLNSSPRYDPTTPEATKHEYESNLSSHEPSLSSSSSNESNEATFSPYLTDYTNSPPLNERNDPQYSSSESNSSFDDKKKTIDNKKTKRQTK